MLKNKKKIYILKMSNYLNMKRLAYYYPKKKKKVIIIRWTLSKVKFLEQHTDLYKITRYKHELYELTKIKQKPGFWRKQCYRWFSTIIRKPR